VLAHKAYGSAPSVASQPARDAGTAHLSVIDQKGNAVALTTTINLGLGARLVAAGVVLNDEMDDFAPAPHSPDVFALSSGKSNRPAPGKRPVSSMSPTIMLGDHGVEAVLGAAGGPRIVSATLQVLLDVLVFGLSPGQALALPRIHHQWEPDVLEHETALPEAVLQSLERKGHRPRLHPGIGKANLILRSAGGLDAASDPRTGGRPAGL
jgi:gamma-glutamyltranspeptidase/glutathione hydrolase